MVILKCCHSVFLMGPVIQNHTLDIQMHIIKGYFLVCHMSLYVKY